MPKTSFRNYAKYSALAFQWIAGFVLFSLGGNWLDTYLGCAFPIFTLTGVTLALVIIFYTLYKLVTQKQDD